LKPKSFCAQCDQEKTVVYCSVCLYEQEPDRFRIFLEQEQQITRFQGELTTEKEATQQALTTAQEWHERQKGEIIAEWKNSKP